MLSHVESYQEWVLSPWLVLFKQDQISVIVILTQSDN